MELKNNGTVINALILDFSEIDSERFSRGIAFICIDTQTNLIEGCDALYNPSGALYNDAIKGGDFFADAILMESLKGGYVSGVFSDKNLNPYLTLTIAPIEGEDVDPVEPGVYSLANDFAPKVDEVIKVSKAYYNGSENTLRAYAPGGPQGQSLTVDISLFDYDFKDGYSYNVTGVINIKEPWTATSGKGLMDYVYPFQNYKILVLDADELAPPTAIDNIVAEQGVKSVRFYNAAGVESKVPFQGVNIVVKEMIDGSKVTTKAIIK